MGKTNSALLVVCFSALFISAAQASWFWNDFYAFFGQNNVKFPGPKVGRTVVLSMTNQTGSGFRSYSPYLFGRFSIKIKTMKGYSAGTVTAFHMASNSKNWCELDYEFLGNVTGQPYNLQTNIFVEGIGNREQRINLWFDPSAAYHEYTFLWNQKQVLFLVDTIVIRVFKNQQGLPYLDYQPMFVYGSEWNGDDWATRGGLDKINWAYAPFEASFTAFNIHNSCKVKNPLSLNQLHTCYRKARISTYGQGVNLSLNKKQINDLRWIRQKYLTYDYCIDKARFAGKVPPECRQNWP
ncbi:hypothetical protein R1sor_012094 [Riccia sorocarpa]|uniref:Xyloglucan endotransglucosylase/hydrolase n=1 Tax=Riccia sorocarpa TaxID=122646 RepID=A0ABD3I357_9MARC